MSAQRVLATLVDPRNAQDLSSSSADGEQENTNATGSDDSGGEVLCLDRRASLVNIALGLMGYQVPQVCDVMITHWMDTLHLLLRHSKLTAPKLRRMSENFDMVSKELEGSHLLELIEVLLKAAVYMHSLSPKISSGYLTFVKTKCNGIQESGCDAAWAVEKIIEHVLRNKGSIYDHVSPCVRLHVWRLRPSLLKADLSDLAYQAMQCPLSSPTVELRSCKNFNSLVASLALAPDVFNEAQRLLLSWSTTVRAVRLLELRAQLTAAVNDKLEYPAVTGLAMLDEET